MPVSCHFQGCKALLRTVRRRYIKYHAFAFCLFYPLGYRLGFYSVFTVCLGYIE